MAEYYRRWYDVRLRTLLAWVLLLALGYTAYSYWSVYSDRAARRERELLSPTRGAVCTVVLRQDRLGLAHGGPEPTTIDGVPNYLEGKFAQMNDRWIVLNGLSEGQPQRWIPRENVLVIRVVGE
jgi:hypothetical protein